MSPDLPTRWIEDGEAPAELRALVRTTIADEPAIDMDAALARHEALVATQVGMPEWARTSSRARRIVIAGVIAIASAAALAWALGRDGDDGPQAVASVAVSEPEPRAVATSEPIVPHETVVEPRSGAVAEPAAEPAPRARARTVVRNVERKGDADEVAAMLRIRTALRTDAAHALVEIADADRRFADGYFVEERRAAEIVALDRLGRDDEAARRAEEFLRRWPKSVHAWKVERALGDGNDDVAH